jgi:hypothetical protein
MKLQLRAIHVESEKNQNHSGGLANAVPKEINDQYI